MGSQEDIQSSASNLRMLNDLQNAYMEVIPVPKIEQKLETISRDTHLAITCSPTKGVDETIELSEILVDMGFNVTPHVAAKCVTNESHLVSIVGKLQEKGIESIFVPGGDKPEPAGDFKNAYELLNCLNGIDHRIKNIGIAAHPEGHPDIKDEVLIEELQKKKSLATYIVTQMCFDAE
jgi:methylenetetrahydrofolate reductase (NADPH)